MMWGRGEDDTKGKVRHLTTSRLPFGKLMSMDFSGSCKGW